MLTDGRPEYPGDPITVPIPTSTTVDVPNYVQYPCVWGYIIMWQLNWGGC